MKIVTVDKKKEKLYKFISSSIFFLLIITFITQTLSYQNFEEIEKNFELNTFQSCKTKLFETTRYFENNYPTYELNVSRVEKNLFGLSDIKCLKRINSIEINSESKLINVTVYENIKFYNYLESVLNFLLCIVLIYFNKKTWNTFFYFLLLNFLIDYLFKIENYYYIKIFIPFNNPEGFNTDYFFRIVFLILFTIKSNNKIFLYNGILGFSLIIPDYLGLFALIFLLMVGEIKFKSKNEKYFLVSIPIIYWVTRFIFSIFPKLDLFWIAGGQRIYHGYSRYYDLQWNLLSFRCNFDPNYVPGVNLYFDECRQLYGGVIDNFIKLNLDPYIFSYILMFIFTICLIVIYLKIFKPMNLNENNLFFLVFLFISPPFIFGAFQGNPDIFIFVILFLISQKKKPKILFNIIFGFIFFLFKLHPFGYILGIWIYYTFVKPSFINKAISSFFLFISLLIVLFQFYFFEGGNNIGIIRTKEEAYGLLHLSTFFSNTIDNYLNTKINLYLFLIIFILIILFSASTNKVANFAKKISEISSSNYIYSLMVWYLFCGLFENNSYRLILFLPLFFKMNNFQIKEVNIFLYASIFLIPIPMLSPTTIAYTYFIFFHISFFVLMSIFTRIVFDDLIKSRYFKFLEKFFRV